MIRISRPNITLAKGNAGIEIRIDRIRVDHSGKEYGTSYPQHKHSLNSFLSCVTTNNTHHEHNEEIACGRINLSSKI